MEIQNMLQRFSFITFLLKPPWLFLLWLVQDHSLIKAGANPGK